MPEYKYYNDMTGDNETNLILRALSSDPLKRSKKKYRQQDIDPDPVLINYNDDAIVNISEHSKKRFKSSKAKEKHIKNWSNKDFALYLQTLLRSKGHLVFINHLDANVIGAIHDKLLLKIGVPDNRILKNYLDWWVAGFSSTLNKRIYTSNISYDYLIERFATRYNENSESRQSKPVSNEIVTHEIPDMDLYKAGGLQLLLVSRGIVHTYECIKIEPNPLMRLSQTLRSFSRDVFLEVMESTLRLAPYFSAPVDFISIIRPAADFFNVKTYNKLSFKDFFKNT